MLTRMKNRTSLLDESEGRSAGALYRAVWRWHFYAGLLAAPLAIFLAITGALYLWKPQYEAWRYRDLLQVPTSGVSPVSWDEQFAAASALHPGARSVSLTPSFASGQTSELVIRVATASKKGMERRSVFINPYTGAVVGELAASSRLMTTLHDLHGELMAGKFGQLVVELGASWMFVLLLTGFYLSWPRPRFSVWGFLLPRFLVPRTMPSRDLSAREAVPLRSGGASLPSYPEGRRPREGRSLFWRDLHAVSAVWCSIAALFLLSTGIPWTSVGGGWFRILSAAVGQGSPKESESSAHRSELTGWAPPLRSGLAPQIDALASTVTGEAPVASHTSHAGHEGHDLSMEDPGAKIRSDDPSLPPRISLERVREIATYVSVPEPYAIALPVGPRGVISVISDRNQAFTRTSLHLDQYSGQILADVRYQDYGAMGKFVLWGIMAHEGQLFGLLNQILGTFAAAGVFLISASGLVLWWQRRPAEKWSAPQSTVSLPRPVFLGTLIIAAFLPLLAASLAVVLLGDRWFTLKRRGA